MSPPLSDGSAGLNPRSLYPSVYNRRMTDTGTAARYHRLQLWLALGRLALTAAFLVAVLASGAARALADAAAGAVGSPAMQVALVAAALGVGQALLTLPLAWLSGYV